MEDASLVPWGTHAPQKGQLPLKRWLSPSAAHQHLLLVGATQGAMGSADRLESRTGEREQYVLSLVSILTMMSRAY